MNDWRSAPELLALMDLVGVGPAKALSCARGEMSVDEVDPDDSLPGLVERAKRRVIEYEENGVSSICLFDSDFPDSLRSIPQPPAVLFVRGKPIWPEAALAVVGTREPSTFGQTATEELTGAAVDRGMAIVSGLALGVDGIAHETALEHGGLTIAVLGCGLDSISPRQHAELADRILGSGGSLVSEQPFGTAPGPRTLVARNRLQSGLSKAVLVGQTGLEGGTMHTVRFAAEQGRPIYCPVPRSPSEKSAGLDALLKCPARDLPELVPAWRNHQRLAERLGAEPLGRGITSDSTSAWLDELTKAPIGEADHEAADQLKFDC